MAITFNTTWPPALTDAAWQKKKSFMDKAKSKTKTGLGAELTKAQAAWKLVKWDTMIATKVPMTTPDQVDHAKAAAATIETGLLAQAAHIRDIKLDDFDTAKTMLIQMLAQTKLAAIKRGLTNADVFIKKVKATPTRLVFNTDIQEASRPLTVPLGTIGTTIHGKPDPKALGKNLEKWADGKNELPKYKDAQEEKTKVLEALDVYETAIDGIKHWAV